MRVKETSRLRRRVSGSGGGALDFWRKERLEDDVCINCGWGWSSHDDSLDFSVSESS